MIDHALYLVPTAISKAPFEDVLPSANSEILAEIKFFIVENVREARRFLKRCDAGRDISELTFFELNRHTPLEEVGTFLEPLRRGEPMGVMSDAGCPCVADPGALVVSIAQKEGLRVRPLVGPSSILMSLMASGFNGQGFSFRGYLPIDDAARAAELRRFEEESRRLDMTQIFIETPYRNDRLLTYLVSALNGNTMLCVACDISDPEDEFIRTQSVASWRDAALRGQLPSLGKRPAVFLIYAGAGEAVQQTKNSGKKRSR